MGKFDSKSFNEKSFKYGVENSRVPNLKTNEMKKSKVLKGNEDIRNTFSSQNGTAYAKIAMKGLLDGQAVNYDGETDIEATNTKTFERGVVVVGRAKAWTEKDFADDITGENFMDNVQDQVAEYKDGLDQDILLATLKGIFAMNSGSKNQEFVEKHTYEIEGNMTGTTLNSASNKGCGANKGKIRMVFMTSDVATNLENLNVIEHLKYTDKDGITRDIDLATWNGRLVIIDDDMPTEEVAESEVFTLTTDTVINPSKTYYIKDGEDYEEVSVPDAEELATYYELTIVPAYTKYTTYALGEGSIDYEDIGAKVPYEMSRDAAKNGGEDTLYMRQRKVFAPFGISYEKKNQTSLSPTDEELADGSNWSLVHSGESVAANRSYINHKAIPIVKIVSRG